MKNIALTLTIMCAFGALAYGGTETYSGKDMKQVAPAPAPECFNWTGFYIGGFGGYKYGVMNTKLDPTGDWNLFPDDQNNIHDHAPGDVSTSGAEAGGLIGFNWQFHNCWVVGLEGDGGYLWLRNTESSGTFDDFTQGTSDKSIQTSVKTHYLATLAPRIGYSIGNWLPYVTGGVAFGDIDFAQRLHNTNTGGAGSYHSSGSVSDDNVGWMVGGGLQYAICKHWSVRGQYQYVDLGSASFDAPGSTGFETFSTHNHASLHEHNASLALIFGF